MTMCGSGPGVGEVSRYTGGDEVIFKDFGPGLPECGQIEEKGASEDTIEKESHLNE